MAAKKKVTEAKVNGLDVIVIKPTRPMTKKEMILMSEMVELENKKGGIQQVLIPYSAKFLGTQPEDVKEK